MAQFRNNSQAFCLVFDEGRSLSLGELQKTLAKQARARDCADLMRTTPATDDTKRLVAATAMRAHRETDTSARSFDVARRGNLVGRFTMRELSRCSSKDRLSHSWYNIAGRGVPLLFIEGNMFGPPKK